MENGRADTSPDRYIPRSDLAGEICFTNDERRSQQWRLILFAV